MSHKKLVLGIVIVGAITQFGIWSNFAGADLPAAPATPAIEAAAPATTSVAPTPTESSTTPAEEPTTPEPSTDPADNIDKSDIQLHVKIKSKTCYGYGLGCNVGYVVKVDGAVMSDWPNTGEVEVSYKVIGPEDGSESNTFTVDLESQQYDKPWEEITSTRSRSTKLTVKVTDVEYSE